MISPRLLLRVLPPQLRVTSSVSNALGRHISTVCHLTDDQASYASTRHLKGQTSASSCLSSEGGHKHADMIVLVMQLVFQKVARNFAKKELMPHASEWDEKKHFPVETLKAAAQLGFGGIYIR